MLNQDSEFMGVLNGKMKVYIDPAFKNGEPVTEESLRVGYKGRTTWSDQAQTETKDLLAKLVYENLSEPEQQEYLHLQWCVSEWEAGRNPMEQSFFYCPYIPEGLKDKPFKVKKQSMCGCGFVHGPNERCGPW